ncbi:4-(cytidine 5'-diphospho)-2-C-methyl-D-erythritol kinase [Halodurantibacterium flavum]|uniref:4-diphosphocytidyl-2-C-methyl-D-erythritol kinase n=1 Tax=Halodurantibacterium flavum TaxID=1382802 RepID=A0ABW4S845_9RHOB
MATEGFAPAKINLALHVTGRRADGYHLLDSLVVFADIGDHVRAVPSDALSLDVTGPYADAVPQGPGNLVLRAAALMGGQARLCLEKNLPPASGIGGGSSDAAATLRVLAGFGRALPSDDAVLSLGADLPVCLLARAARMSGIGERLEPLDGLPPLPAVLVNPGIEVSTPRIFTALERRDNPPLPPRVPLLPDAPAMARWLEPLRNDLEAPARNIAPQVGEVILALSAQPDCLLARMSGSGATCFGLFPTEAAAQRAAAALSAAEPGWWVRAGTLGAQAPARMDVAPS